MKRMLGLLVSRGFIILLTVSIQIIFWLVLFSIFSNYQNIIFSLMVALSFICVLYIMIQDMYPEQKLAWIIFMLVIPIAGGIFYLLFGNHKASRKVKRLYKNLEECYSESIDNLKLPNIDNLDASSKRQIEYLNNIAKAPHFTNTKVEYYKIGEDKFEKMKEELKKATKFIFIEYFIIEEGKMWNEIYDIIKEKARLGVDVRVLYDDFGCMLTLPSNFKNKLKKDKIKCLIFNKLVHVNNSNFNNRDHRKICIVDGNVGFTGGVNIADEYINVKDKYGHWKDTALMLKGDAVYGLTIMFLQMWNLESKKMDRYSDFKPTIKIKTEGIVHPFADTPLDNESVGEGIYMSILNTAKEYVYITTPYLIISREMMTALCNAAKSNVDVRLILPSNPDKKFVQFLSRSYYETLIKSGVKIYEYKPGFMHAKMFISDDVKSIVGTINLDYRSLDLHYECGVMLHNCKVIKDIKKDFDNTLNECEEITLAKVFKTKRFGFFKFILLGILRTFSPLM